MDLGCGVSGLAIWGISGFLGDTPMDGLFMVYVMAKPIINGWKIQL